jgi:hypothetical protein
LSELIALAHGTPLESSVEVKSRDTSGSAPRAFAWSMTVPRISPAVAPAKLSAPVLLASLIACGAMIALVSSHSWKCPVNVQDEPGVRSSPDFWTSQPPSAPSCDPPSQTRTSSARSGEAETLSCSWVKPGAPAG